MFSGKDLWGPQGDGFVKTKPGDFRITAMKIKCPGECIKKTANKMPLIGPAMPENEKDIMSAFKYTLDTSICAAAIHSSIISEQQGGMVIYHLTKESKGYLSSEQNGLKSVSGDKTTASVYIKPGPETTVMGCTEPANSQLKIKSGAK